MLGEGRMNLERRYYGDSGLSGLRVRKPLYVEADDLVDVLVANLLLLALLKP